MKDTLTYLINALLEQNKIRIDKEEFAFQIKSHPSFPSLHSITGVLDHFNIENLAMQIPLNEETLSQLPPTFLAQIKKGNDTSIVLVTNKGLKYKIIFNGKEQETISLKTFLAQFTGVMVAVDNIDSSTLKPVKGKNYLKPLSLIAIALFAVLFFTSGMDKIAIAQFVLSIAGVAISFLVIQHDLGVDSKIMNSICSQESKVTNCNAVLNSKGATLFKGLKLGDASAIYFMSTSISWLLVSLSKTQYTPLLVISALATPMIIYSIYYQIAVAKSWCSLCLGIVSILILQAIIAFFPSLDAFKFPLSGTSMLLMGFSFFSVAAIWLFVISKLKKEQEFNALKIEATKFKRNFELFNTLLETSKSIETTLSNTSEIIFGNSKAPLNITVITNPFCGYCKVVHNLMEDILKKHHQKVSITIRFNISLSQKDSDTVKIASRLLEIYHEDGEAECMKAMSDIYNDNNASTWLKQWKSSKKPELYIDILEHEKEWCNKNNINFTPELLINGKAFPQAYNRSDLSYFIEDLYEFAIETSSTSQFKQHI